jgi:hypothetical protein
MMYGIPRAGAWSWTDWTPLTLAVGAVLYIGGLVGAWALLGARHALQFGISVALLVTLNETRRRLKKSARR